MNHAATTFQPFTRTSPRSPCIGDRPREGGELVDPAGELLGLSSVMQDLRATIHRVGSRGEASVLLLGESGTGKDLAARAIHACSPRSESPFVNVTCTALPAALLESELFGHERGAFTDAKQRHVGMFEQARGGTLFLDEIGDMDPIVQAKLLRVLEDRKVRRVGGSEDIVIDVRVIAATNVDLRARVRAGTFRADLYYRLAVMMLHVPALRDRAGDVQMLAEAFLRRFLRPEQVLSDVQLSPAGLRKLKQHPWPGNVRELRNAIERAAVLVDGGCIDAADLQLEDTTVSAASPILLPAGGIDIGRLERDLVLQAIERTQGNVTTAGHLLCMTRDQVRYRLAKYRRAAECSSSLDGSASAPY